MKLILGRAQQTWNDYDSVNETFLCLTENAKSSAFRGHLNERSNMPTHTPTGYNISDMLFETKTK